MDVVEPYGFVYITTNRINGKRYIGQRVFKNKGWEKYLGSGYQLVDAIKKYGRENFTKDIVHIAYSEDELDEQETKLIQFFDAANSDDYYNILPNASTMGHNIPHTEEAKKRMSEDHWWYKLSKEEQDRRRKELAAMATGEKSHFYGRSYFEGISGKDHPNYGKVRTDEVREKLSIAAKKKYENGFRHPASKYIDIIVDDKIHSFDNQKDAYQFCHDSDLLPITKNNLKQHYSHFNERIRNNKSFDLFQYQIKII